MGVEREVVGGICFFTPCQRLISITIKNLVLIFTKNIGPLKKVPRQKKKREREKISVLVSVFHRIV